MTDREKLMKKIQACCFGAFEASLFLDTHKHDKDALEYFNKHNKMCKEYSKEYVEKYGPLNLSDNNSTSSWQWTDGPWPWEYSSDSNAK